MYLYLAGEDDFDAVPDELLARFGQPAPVMSLDLGEVRALARVARGEVIAALREQGYFLQLPPKLEPDLYHGDGMP